MKGQLLDTEKLKRGLAKSGFDLGVSAAPVRPRKRKIKPLSGKELSRRLAGLLTAKEADDMERHINESCEREND